MTNIFAEKKIKADILQQLYEQLEQRERYDCMDYRKTGEQKQRWDYGNHCPKVDDDGEPVMDDVYDYFPIPEEEITDEQRIKLKVIGELKVAITKLL